MAKRFVLNGVLGAGLVLLLAACNYHPTPPHGHGGFAEWDWPYQTEDGEVYAAARSDYAGTQSRSNAPRSARNGVAPATEDRFVTSTYERRQPQTQYERPDGPGVWYDQPPQGQGLWSYQVPHPDYLPTVFRTTELRLRRHQEGYAVHYMPAFIVQAEKQWNKALRAFAGELYQDAFHDLRQLNLRLDEIDHRMSVTYGPKGSYTPNGCVGTDPTLPCNRGGIGPAFTPSVVSPYTPSGPVTHSAVPDTGLQAPGHFGQLGGYCGSLRGGHLGPAVVAPYAMYGCAQGRQKHWPDMGCSAKGGACATAGPVTCGAPAHMMAPVYHSGPAPSGQSLPATFGDNLFAHDSDVVEAHFAAYLRQLVSFYSNDPAVNFVLHGHTDRSGADDYNQDLSARRVANVRTALLQAGLPAHRITAGYFGEERPTAQSSPDAKGRERQDRRVEIFVNRQAATAFWTGYCTGAGMGMNEARSRGTTVPHATGYLERGGATLPHVPGSSVPLATFRHDQPGHAH